LNELENGIMIYRNTPYFTASYANKKLNELFSWSSIPDENETNLMDIVLKPLENGGK
jgi:hypothetical protein